MVQVGSSSFAITDRPVVPGAAPETGPTIVWLQGEHDIATDGALHHVLGSAIVANDAPIVLDLREVELLGASTLGIIVAARELLRQQSTSLTLRSPSPFVQRIIGICGLSELLSMDDLRRPSGQEGDGEEGNPIAWDALGTWVVVPPAQRSDVEPNVPIPASQRLPQSAAAPGGGQRP